MRGVMGVKLTPEGGREGGVMGVKLTPEGGIETNRGDKRRGREGG